MTKNVKKILVVEDEISLKNILSDKLKKEGFKVFSANNGEDGLSMAISKQPDLVLLDIVMPKMDGLTMLKNLRSNEKCKNIGVIILSNLSDNENAMIASQSGASDYMIKTNWSLENVVNKIREYFAKHPE